MQANSVYVFKTPFYTPHYKEFYSLYDLKDFLQRFNFMRSHKNTNIPTGLPEFRLGYRVGVVINGFYYKSDVKWGPRFIVAKSIREEKNGDIFALVPMDIVHGDEDSNIRREYGEIKFNKSTADAIIDLSTLKQIWPKRHKYANELERFLRQVIKNTKKTTRVRGY